MAFKRSGVRLPLAPPTIGSTYADDNGRRMLNFDRVTECNCSICTKKGFLRLIVPPGQFQLVSGKDHLTTYEFNTKTAKHAPAAFLYKRIARRRLASSSPSENLHKT
jgi:hypothetical protein